MGDMHHVCRWCVHFYNGKCFRGIISTDNTVEAVYSVAESGRLSETIEETLNSIKPQPFERELKDKLKEWGLSGKRIEEFWKLFTECLGEYLDMKCKPELDEKISVLYQTYAEDYETKSRGVEIKDPESFYCKEWE